MSKDDLMGTLTIHDLALWYLDDGCLIKRREYKDRVYNRYILCIGDSANTQHRLDRLSNRLKYLFGNKWGRIQKNNSRATENNKVWVMPKVIAETYILPLAYTYGVLPKKFPYGEGSTTIR